MKQTHFSITYAKIAPKSC